MKKILFLGLVILSMVYISCSDDKKMEDHDDLKIQELPKLDNVSLDYHSSEQMITLARDVESEGAIVSLKDNSYWISKLNLSGSTLSFNILENTEVERGHRFDTIIISNKGVKIGSICVSQARKPISTKRLVWAISSAMYRNDALCKSDMSGQEITKAIYNLSKTTNGKDSYKNYPAFAYCIEMNHDPEKNMEWHLPSLTEMRGYANAQSYEGTPIIQHNYWWTATENSLRGDAFSLYSKSVASRGSVSKGQDWWIMAFRNGEMIE